MIIKPRVYSRESKRIHTFPDSTHSVLHDNKTKNHFYSLTRLTYAAHRIIWKVYPFCKIYPLENESEIYLFKNLRGLLEDGSLIERQFCTRYSMMN